MARCGCTQTCACVVQGGECIEVAGNGGPNTPYVVSLIQGCAQIVTEDTNTVDLEGNGTTANPLTAKVKRVGDNLGPLNNTPGGGANLLKENTGPDGLYVSCEDIQDCIGAAMAVGAGDCLEYDDVANSYNVSICAEPNGVECVPNDGSDPACPAGGLLVRPSSDAGNTLDFGSDDRLYVPQSGQVTVLDTQCIDMTLTGSGTVPDPYVLSADPILAPEPNGIDCTPTGLAVLPSTDPGNTLTFGSDNSLFVPGNNSTGSIDVLDTQCIDMTLTGTGTVVDPYIISATPVIDPNPVNALSCGPTGLFVAPSLCPVPLDTSCINMTVTGSGTIGDPCVISADPIIDPDPCNALECRAGGLFVLDDTGNGFSARADRCSSDGPPENDPQPLPGGRTTVINTQTITITNNNTCRAMRVVLHVDFPQTIVQTDTGVARVIGMISEDGGPLADAVSQTVLGAPGVAQFVNMQTSRVQGILIPPGGSLNYQAQLDVDLNGGSPGAFAQGCIAISAIGHLVDP